MKTNRIDGVLEEIRQAPNMFDDLVRLELENKKLKETIKFLEHLLDRERAARQQ